MGLIHIYTGDGKGKTTTSLGLIVRALGADYNVVFCQFLKSSESSEIPLLKTLDKTLVFRLEKKYKFSWLLTDEEKMCLKADQNALFKQAVENLSHNKTLLIFDELCASFSKNLIDKNLVLDFLKNKTDNLEIVLTGRNPEKSLVDLADYISEFQKIKHPYDKGVHARKGIEL